MGCGPSLTKDCAGDGSCCDRNCPCCPAAADTAAINWPGGLTAKADCDGCDKIPAGEYDATWESLYAPFGAACYWVIEIGAGAEYPDCGAGLIFGTDAAAPGPEATFLVVLIHDLISGKCYLIATVAVAIVSAETVGGNTVNFLVGALYVSAQHDEPDYFCSGEFTLNLASSDPGYHDSSGNLLWTEPNWGDPFVTTDFTPYIGGCDGALPASLTVTF